MNGINLIRHERIRQVREVGWSALHDTQWDNGELVKAAICYAMTGISKKGEETVASLFWPWAAGWYKPRFDDSDLVRAGALIAAELDRRHGVKLGRTSVGPKVVCLCGSTRFWREFQRAGLEETMNGNIVLSIGAASGTDDEHFGNLPREEYDRVKAMLDELHLRKIDMADEVLILNPDGYIGESTGRELMHAFKLGKKIRFLEPMAPKAGWSWMRWLPEPMPKIQEGHTWGLFAYCDSEGWVLTASEVDEDGDDVGERTYDVDWPFPVDYGRAEDFAALGFEIL